MKYLVACLAVMILSISGPTPPYASKDNFNIVLITIDTLRADHLSCYGYERETSPNIDKIAKQGILFKNVIAPSSWTAPSMVSLFTSTYPVNHGVIHGLAFQEKKGFSQEVFSEKIITLPAMLKKQGYTTFGVSSNNHLTAKFGFARGFDYFEYVNWQPADLINKIIYSWEDKINKASKFFLWVHYIDPHSPYNPQSPWIEQYVSEKSTNITQFITQLRNMPQGTVISKLKQNPEMLSKLLALYDSEINFVDSYVGKLIKRFKLNENTLLVITSDHGEQFLEHGKIRHSQSLHTEELHVPLIIKLPDVWKMESIERQVSLLDVMPTILHLLNTDQPKQTTGKPLLKNEDILSRLKKMLLRKEASVYNFAELDSNTRLKTILTPKWKYIYDYNNESEQLYNVISDPLEQKNILDGNSKQGEVLKEQLFAWVSQAKIYPPKRLFFQLSQEEKEKLETLGYLNTQKNDDIDGDGVYDKEDNCYYLFNPNQLDSNGDGIGDACLPSSLKKLWLEAERADTIVSPLEIATDENASNGRFIYAPNGTGNEYTPGGTIRATYTVHTVQAGVYILWGRVKVSDKRGNSFFVQVDNGKDNLWEIEPGNSWHWDLVNNRNKADPVKFILTTGTHTIKVKLREDGTKLDKLLLTNNVDFVPTGKGDIGRN